MAQTCGGLGMVACCCLVASAFRGALVSEVLTESMDQKGGLLLQNQPCGHENGEEEDKEEVSCGVLVVLCGSDGGIDQGKRALAPDY